MNFVGFCQPFFGFYESSFLYTVVNFFISVDSEASCFLFSQVYLFNWLTLTNNTTNIISIGNVLYTLFFNGFIISSVVLLIAMIGSIVLTINKPFLLVDKLFLLKIK